MHVPRSKRFGNALTLCVLLLLNVRCARAEVSPQDVEFFETRIRPVLVKSCYPCHAADAQAVEGELLLDNRASLLKGGKSGPVVTPGDPDSSRLLIALTYRDATLQMPPDGPLAPEVVADFRQWIALGAADPREGGAATPADLIAARAAQHWAFRPPLRPAIPCDATGWSRTPYDRLALAQLQALGLKPSPPASRRAVVRRLYYDLVGLPPTADAMDEVLGDQRSDALDRLTDRLLSSGQFGERWARHWLDVARYADTKGYVFTEDRTFPNAFQYRDWVIDAFNSDMPIDQFLMRQIAPDKMPNADDSERDLAGHGYLTLGRRFLNNPADINADRIDVVFRGMMGLTVACARCHDHKFDPFSAADYYAIYGIFASSQEQQDEDQPLRLIDREAPENVGVFVRGNAHNRTDPVQRGFLRLFASFAKPVAQGSGRLELAQALVSPENPLTARVFVNRVWGRLFGKPLVSTPSDWGLRCEPPPQQALLDALAVDFVEHGWSLKWLVREVTRSSVYRQSCDADGALVAADPENRLLGRAERRRLDFESLRDSLLAVAGRLDCRVGGPSQAIDATDDLLRRTLYAHIDRQNLPGLFRTFDFASPDAHVPQRAQTIVPQQGLYLMNGPLPLETARRLAASLEGSSAAERITHLYRRVLARAPDRAEMEAAEQFLSQGDQRALLAQALLLSNEFAFLD